MPSDEGSVSGNRYHSFRTENAKSCRLLRLQVVVVGGEAGGVPPVGGTVTVPPPALPPLPPPPPQADVHAAKMRIMFLSEPVFIPICLPLFIIAARRGAPKAIPQLKMRDLSLTLAG